MLYKVIGDAAYPNEPGPKIIAHVVNDQGAWGAGFTRALSHRWKRAEWNYREWATNWKNKPGAECFRLGHVRYCLAQGDRSPEEHELEEPIWIAHMLAQQGLRDTRSGYFRPLRYDALGACLMEVGRFAKLTSATVHMPQIGAGLAGGEWMIIAAMVNDALVREGVPTYIYQLPMEGP